MRVMQNERYDCMDLRSADLADSRLFPAPYWRLPFSDYYNHHSLRLTLLYENRSHCLFDAIVSKHFILHRGKHCNPREFSFFNGHQKRSSFELAQQRSIVLILH